MERLLLTRVCLMVYVRAGGAATFADMAEAPVPSKESAEKKPSAKMSGAAAPSSAVRTPPRGAAGRGVPAAPPPGSCETTPSCAPPRKRMCVQCNGEFDDLWESMSLVTGSAHSTPLRSPPTKCLKCTPGQAGSSATYAPELPVVPAWPTGSAVQGLSSSEAAASAAAAKGPKASAGSAGLERGLQGLSLKSPDRQKDLQSVTTIPKAPQPKRPRSTPASSSMRVWSYQDALKPCGVSKELNSFVTNRLSLQGEQPWRLSALEAGGGGDCFFHSVAAGLEQMIQKDDGAKRAILQRLDQNDFARGHRHLVQKLRDFVAGRVAGQTEETLLNMRINFQNQKQLGWWHDDWHPSALLCGHGFGFALAMDTVEGVGANEDGMPTDIVVQCRRGQELQPHVVEDGANKLAMLRVAVADVFRTCGNLHWATETDIAALAEHLGIGFIVFASREQGTGKWIQGLSLERGDYAYWMMIYWIDPVHYQLAQFHRDGDPEPRTFFAIDDVPLELRSHYDLCNGARSFGRAYHGGVS